MPVSIKFPRQSHIAHICTIFLQIEFSNVFSNSLPEQMQIHIGYICMSFLQSEFPNVISNCPEPPIAEPFLTSHEEICMCIWEDIIQKSSSNIKEISQPYLTLVFEFLKTNYGITVNCANTKRAKNAISGNSSNEAWRTIIWLWWMWLQINI